MEVLEAVRLSVALLGHLRLAFDGEPFEFGAPRKTLPILAYLLIHRGAAVSRDFLAFTMWPDADEEVARNNLRRNLTLFKSVLPPPEPAETWILATNEFVRWNQASPYALDVAEFERLCVDPASFEEAIDLYGGDLLEDIYDDWVYPERERLRAAYLSTLKALVLRHRSARDFTRAIGYAQRLLAADPLREDVARDLAAIRYQAGDRAGALRALDAFVERMHVELEIGPMPETTVLREAILRGEAAGGPARDGDAAAPVGRRPTRRPEFPFVGRDAPMERATMVWDRAARGHGAVVFLGGEAGIGKTRFAEELALRAKEEGGRVLVGATTSPEVFAYQPFVEALRSAIPLLVASNVGAVWLNVLATVIPELAGRTESASIPALRPDEERTRLLESLTRAFLAIARTRPLLLVLEDMHWSGSASVELLRFVGRRIANERVAIVATYRSEETLRAHPLRVVRRELIDGGTGVILDLTRLELPAVASIIARLEAKENQVVGPAEDLHSRSLGNPLFLGELVREHLERNVLAASAGALADARTTIESTIAARLGRLGNAARRAMDIAAVVGDTFDFELVGEVTGWETSALLDALDELIERHLVHETTRRERGAYAFTHHLIRATAYAKLAVDARRRYHGIIARAINALYRSYADQWASDLARHYENAGEPLPAAQAWLRAARAALAAFANDEAVAAASRGLEMLAAGSADVRLYADLLAARADAFDRLANRESQTADIHALIDLARTEEQPELLRQALRREIEFAIVVGDEPRLAAGIAALEREIEPHAVAWQAELQKAEARLAADRFEYNTAMRVGAAAIAGYRACDDPRGEFETLLVLIDARIRHNRYEENRADLERATQLARNSDDPQLKARLLQSVMMEPILKQDFSTAYCLAGELLELSRSTGNRLGEARALETRATAANRNFALREAVDGYGQALAIYESIGERRGMRNVENNWGSLDVALGKVARGRERLERMLASAEADGDLRMRYFAHSNLGVAAYFDGDWAAAKIQELRALELARRLGSQGFVALVLGDLGVAERELGDLDGALAYLEEAIAIHCRLDQRLELLTNQARLAIVYAMRGDCERTRALAFEISAYERAHPDLVEDPGEVLWNAAQSLHRCGHHGEARALVERAAERQAARIASVELPEYRESMAGLRWYRALLRAKAADRWPEDGEDAAATPV